MNEREAQALAPQECDAKECAIELKYAPRKCEYFCMGDCCLPETNRSCGTDKDNCEYYNLYVQILQLKAENEILREQWDMCGQEGQEIIAELSQKLEKAKEALEFYADGKNWLDACTPYTNMNKLFAQQALKELE